MFLPQQMNLLLFFAAEIAPISSFDVQTTCMRNLVVSPQPNTNSFRLLFSTDDETFENVCSYRNIRCEEEAVIALVFPRVNTIIWKLHLQWLPSTTQVAYFSGAHVSQLNMDVFPRDLRFLCLNYCSTYNTLINVNLARLPNNIEELHLFYGFRIGPVSIAQVPQSLRILQIVQSNIDSVQIDCSNLSDNLKHIFVGTNGRDPTKSVTRFNRKDKREGVLQKEAISCLTRSPYKEIVEGVYDSFKRDSCL